ncbi:hypothetical protein CA13_67670 [Planctomycetes bacterium CA13]|uniref:SGNH hydrolase-type esterase domain-containing protein n=1 Tax=Novipirellula herctigrandis TaxID=2527986 RepID=A0A5C5YMW8_9BACT|nr:hypothetical protein CA13_67670 [Planctomycetes bacterium CA13]
MKRLRLIVAAAAIFFGVNAGYSQETVLASNTGTIAEPATKSAFARWENDISRLEALDKTLEPNEDAILFIGSSSIRLWDSIAEDMAPYRVIKRGFGGAKYDDLAFFSERLIEPHVYRAMVVFIANDVSGSPQDHSPEEVNQWARQVIAVSHQHHNGAPVFLIEVTPTESRFSHWEKTRAINATLREIALTTPDTYFVPTAEHFLTSEDQPRKDLFRDDRLHLSEAGYDVWGKLIRSRLNDVLRQQK